MILVGSFLGPYDRSLVQHVGRFLKALGATDDEYKIAPDTKPLANALALVTYSAGMFGELSNKTTLRLNVGNGYLTQITGLSEALHLLSFMFDDRTHFKMLAKIKKSETEAEVISRLGLSHENDLRPGVKSYSTGTYLSPVDGGFCYFSVDTHGEIVVRATASDLLPVAFHLWSVRKMESNGLLERAAAYAQPFEVQ